MGTRSTTKIVDERGITLCNMYRQYDGYFSGHGLELAEFLDGKEVINGISGQSMEVAANGMGCLAAQMIAHFKTDIGGIYLDSPDATEEYNYIVKLKDGKLVLEGRGYEDEVFIGTPREFREMNESKELS
jgi:hypothetical protein